MFVMDFESGTPLEQSQKFAQVGVAYSFSICTLLVVRAGRAIF